MNEDGLDAGMGAKLKNIINEPSKDASNLDKEKESQHLKNEIEKAVKGLYYISETDAEILPFIGSKTNAVSKENVINQTKNAPNTPIEERDFEEFFADLIKIQDWFGDKEKENASKFSSLADLLKKNLRDLKVFKVGSIELDIYVVGLNQEDILIGIETKAVET